jgi:phenylpropionate dioxygenase-like ring-hydroxylating dioxygenase large terminal subunit
MVSASVLRRNQFRVVRLPPEHFRTVVIQVPSTQCIIALYLLRKVILAEQSSSTKSRAGDGQPGAPLAPWTYSNSELFELEYTEFFLKRWQFVGHVNEVVGVGDYITADIGRDNVLVVRGKDEELRAFLNVCRHRASRILEGAGTCRGVIRCPYHGWTYQFDGSLMAIPQQDDFPGIDRSDYGLRAVQLEVFNGLIFIRVAGSGRSVAEQFSHTADFFEKYDVANYEQIAPPTAEVWDVNWKVAWDNYLENYHIAIGHPGLQRLLIEDGEADDLSSGVSYGVFVLKDMPSKVEEERRYQELLQHADYRLPDDLKGKWVQFGLAPNLGLDLYPEMLDLFRLVPLAPDKTMVRAAYYGHKNPTPEEMELRRLNIQINERVNEEDRQLCTRVQQGLSTYRYRPGPLSQQESTIFNFHEMMRKRLPVMSLEHEPGEGLVAAENDAMLKQG